MKKFILAILAISLSGCSFLGQGQPGNIEDACAIMREKPIWRAQIKKTEEKWDVPASVQMAIIYTESKFEARAKTPRKYKFGIIPAGRISSAYGFAQVIDGTWDMYRKNTGNRYARRDNFGDAVDFIGWYSDISYRQLGISKSDAKNLYLAYHQGHAGFEKGYYRDKQWLVDIAVDTARVEQKYRQQLSKCWW